MNPSWRDATAQDVVRYTRTDKNAADTGHFIGDGLHTVKRMLATGAAVELLGLPERLEPLEIPSGVTVLVARHEQIMEIHGPRYHTGLMATGRIPVVEIPRTGLTVALDGVHDAENVGAILRTAAALGADALVCGETATSPWIRRAVRVSMAAGLVLPAQRVEDLAAFVGARRAYAAVVDDQSVPHWEVDWRGDGVVVVLGAEDHGVRPEVRKQCVGSVRIPMFRGVDSLNVAASAAVLLAEAARQRLPR